MSNDGPPALKPDAGTMPMLSYYPLSIGLRYLLKKPLSYLAMIGVALSVGVLIVVMSVFTGFHIRLTEAIRGYLSDLTIEPLTGTMYSFDSWEAWRRQVLEVEHVEGCAPFVQGAGLIRERGTGRMTHVMFRGVHPDLEPTVSKLSGQVKTGTLKDLRATYRTADGGEVKACFLGYDFFGYVPDDLVRNPRELVLVTVTPNLQQRLIMYAVNGIFQTGNYNYDSRVVLLGLDAACKLVESGGGVSGLTVRLDDYENAPTVRADLLEKLSPGARFGTFETQSGKAERVALSADGSRLAAAAPGGELSLWDTGSDDPPLQLALPEKAVTTLALGPEGKGLLTGYRDGSAEIYRLDAEARPVRVASDGQAVTAACFSPDGMLLALGRENGMSELRDAETGEELAVLRGHTGAVKGMAFDGVSEQLVTVAADGAPRVWDAEEGTLVGVLPSSGHEPVNAAGFSPNGDLIVTGAGDGAVTIWELDGLKALHTWEAHDSAVLSVSFGWTSDVVLTAGADGVRCWELHGVGDARIGLSVSVERSFQVPVTEGKLTAVSFRADGKRTATLDDGGKVHLDYTGGPFSVVTWEDQERTFLEAIAMEQFLQALILSLMLVLEGFFIFAIVTTIVYERRRDIGIMKAIGFRKRQICQVFVVAGLAIGVVGALLGVVGGLLFADNINAVREFLKVIIKFDPFPPTVYYFKEIPTHVGWVNIVVTVGGAILCSLIFSIVPALRAARMDPIEALHHE